MQEILPPSRGRVRPVSRISTARASVAPSRQSHTPSIAASASPCQPNFTPNTPPTPSHPKPIHELFLSKSSRVSGVSHRTTIALARTNHKLHLVDRLNARQARVMPAVPVVDQSRKTPSLWGRNKRSLLAGVSVVLILAVTGFISYDTWHTNNLAKEAFAKNSNTDEVLAVSPENHQSAEGKDESPLPTNALSTYRVAPNLPRALYINKINIAARVLPMGVNTDGSMQAPLGIYDAGWYSGSVRPGETGAMVVNGHSSGPTRQGLFGRLDTLQVGDEVSLEKGDTTKLRYKVMFIETVPLSEVDMNKVSLPYGTATSGLNIYTCTGKWIPEKSTFDHRVIVYTAQVK